MKIFLISLTVISSVLMVIVILLQQGKGADLGSAFGRGAQGGLVEATGKANFLSRTTSALAVVFLLSSLALSLFVSDGNKDGVIRELESNSGGVVQQLQIEDESENTENTEPTTEQPATDEDADVPVLVEGDEAPSR